MPRAKPWAKLGASDRVDAVRPLEAAGRANSTIAYELKAPRSDVDRICAFLRRERHARAAAPESQSSGADAVLSSAPSLGASFAGHDSDESPATNPVAKASEDNGRITGGAGPVAGEASRRHGADHAGGTPPPIRRASAERRDSDTCERPKAESGATAGETAQNSPEGAITGAVTGWVDPPSTETGSSDLRDAISAETNGVARVTAGETAFDLQRPAYPAVADGQPSIPTDDARGAGRGVLPPLRFPQSTEAVTNSEMPSTSSRQAPRPSIRNSSPEPMAKPERASSPPPAPATFPDWSTTDRAERDRIIIEACKAGASTGEIAAMFSGASRSAVVGRIFRLRQGGMEIRSGGGNAPKLRKREPVAKGRPWSEMTPREKDAAALAGRAEGLSYRQIGERHGTTEHAAHTAFARAGGHRDKPKRSETKTVAAASTPARQTPRQSRPTALPLRPQMEPKVTNMVEAWLAKNGGPRRFERGATADLDILRNYVAKRGYTIGFTQRGGSRYTIEGPSGRPKTVDRKGLFRFVDELRRADGLEPVLPPSPPPSERATA